MLDLNVVGLLETVRAFLPDLTAAGRDGRPADLVITSSIGARETFPGYAVYGATKAAANYLGRAWRAELAPLGVRVTLIEPGLPAPSSALTSPAGEGADLLASMFDQIPALAPTTSHTRSPSPSRSPRTPASPASRSSQPGRPDDANRS